MNSGLQDVSGNPGAFVAEPRRNRDETGAKRLSPQPPPVLVEG